MDNNSEKQRQLESETRCESEWIYKGRIIALRSDIMHFKGHPPVRWDFVTHPGAVAIVPINSAGNLLLVKQWRRAIGKITLELPAGVLEKGEDPLFCARRELQEETGFHPGELISLGGFYSAPGFCNEYLHLYLARMLTHNPLPQDDHESIDLVEISLEDALKLIDTHQLIDAKTICGILHYARYEAKERA